MSVFLWLAGARIDDEELFGWSVAHLWKLVLIEESFHSSAGPGPVGSVFRANT